MWRAIPWRLLVCVLLLVSALVVLFERAGNIEELGRTLAQAQALPLLVAVVLQLLTLVNQPALYQSLYALFGIPLRWRDLAPLVWTGHFLNVATPSAGLGGTALLLADARRRGLDISRASLANSLYFLLNFAWFAVLLAFGLTTLWLRHDLNSAEIVAAGVLLGVVVVGFGALIAVALAPQWFERLLVWGAIGLNRASRKVAKRDVLSPESARSFVAESGVALRTLRGERRGLLRPLFHTLWVDGLEILVLGACFWAFPGVGTISPALLVAGYSIGTLFLVVSITPQGLGVVEGVMTAIFVSLGVPLERAAVVVLVYRGLSFWLPLVAGFVVSRRALLPSLQS